jgi:hypothetical protein
VRRSRERSLDRLASPCAHKPDFRSSRETDSRRASRQAGKAPSGGNRAVIR